MRLYIDESNLISFFAAKGAERYEDCLRMMKRQLDVFFYFGKERLKEDKNLAVLVQGAFASGAGATRKCFIDTSAEEFPDRPLKGNCCSSFNNEQLSSVYLLSDDAGDKIGCLKLRGNIIIGTKGEELDTLSQLFYDDYQYEYKLPISQMKGKGWAILKRFSRPCSDILIIDNYILSDQTLYDSNFYPLIRSLVSRGNGSVINIVIVTKKENHNRVGNYNFVPDWNDIRARVKAEVKQETGARDTNVTFLFLPNDIKEHDRTIITNYLRINSGDSYNYLNSRLDIITKSQCMDINSRAFAKNHTLADEAVRAIQTKLDETRRRNPCNIIGDGKSHLLSF